MVAWAGGQRSRTINQGRVDCSLKQFDGYKLSKLKMSKLCFLFLESSVLFIAGSGQRLWCHDVTYDSSSVVNDVQEFAARNSEQVPSCQWRVVFPPHITEIEFHLQELSMPMSYVTTYSWNTGNKLVELQSVLQIHGGECTSTCNASNCVGVTNNTLGSLIVHSNRVCFRFENRKGTISGRQYFKFKYQIKPVKWICNLNPTCVTVCNNKRTANDTFCNDFWTSPKTTAEGSLTLAPRSRSTVNSPTTISKSASSALFSVISKHRSTKNVPTTINLSTTGQANTVTPIHVPASELGFMSSGLLVSSTPILMYTSQHLIQPSKMSTKPQPTNTLRTAKVPTTNTFSSRDVGNVDTRTTLLVSAYNKTIYTSVKPSSHEIISRETTRTDTVTDNQAANLYNFSTSSTSKNILVTGITLLTYSMQITTLPDDSQYDMSNKSSLGIDSWIIVYVISSIAGVMLIILFLICCLCFRRHIQGEKSDENNSTLSIDTSLFRMSNFIQQSWRGSRRSQTYSVNKAGGQNGSHGLVGEHSGQEDLQTNTILDVYQETGNIGHITNGCHESSSKSNSEQNQNRHHVNLRYTYKRSSSSSTGSLYKHVSVASSKEWRGSSKENDPFQNESIYDNIQAPVNSIDNKMLSEDIHDCISDLYGDSLKNKPTAAEKNQEMITDLDEGTSYTVHSDVQLDFLTDQNSFVTSL